MKKSLFIYTQITASAIVLIVLLMGSVQVSAQGVELDKFDVFRHDNQVFLSWVVAKGGTCNGIQIERSTDNRVFETIGYIYGVCGSVSEPRPYSFVDENPVANQTNYYRLELGNQGYSETRSLEYRVYSDGLTVGPNPAKNQTEVRFNNPLHDVVNLEVYNMSGKLVGELEATSNTMQLDLTQFHAGVYLLRLTRQKNGETFTSRLVVAE